MEASEADMNTDGILVPAFMIESRINDPNFQPTLADINRIQITPEMESFLAEKQRQREAEEERLRQNYEDLLQQDLQLFETPGDSNKYSMREITQALLDSYEAQNQLNRYPIAIPTTYNLAPDPDAEDAPQQHDTEFERLRGIREYNCEEMEVKVKWQTVQQTRIKRYVRVNKRGKKLLRKYKKDLAAAAEMSLQLEKEKEALEKDKGALRDLLNKTAKDYREHLSDLVKKNYELKKKNKRRDFIQKTAEAQTEMNKEYYNKSKALELTKRDSELALKQQQIDFVNQNAESMNEFNQAYSDLSKRYEGAQYELDQKEAQIEELERANELLRENEEKLKAMLNQR